MNKDLEKLRAEMAQLLDALELAAEAADSPGDLSNCDEPDETTARMLRHPFVLAKIRHAVEAEREACAQVVDQDAEKLAPVARIHGGEHHVLVCAAAKIRKRGEGSK